MGAGEENNVGYLGFTSKLPEEDHRDGWTNARAIEYIEQRADDRPLFLYLSYLKPHAGHNVPAGYEDRYDVSTITYAQQPPWTEDYSPHAAGVNRRDMYVDYWKDATPEQWRLMTMRYYANVTWIDDMMGRTLNALKKKGILDNALIVYTSDHGESLGEHYYRFNKYSLYESSVRVPLIISGSALPAGFEPGTADYRSVDLVDILPTLLDAAGIPRDGKLPGVDLLTPPARQGGFSALHEREGEAAFMWADARGKADPGVSSAGECGGLRRGGHPHRGILRPDGGPRRVDRPVRQAAGGGAAAGLSGAHPGPPPPHGVTTVIWPGGYGVPRVNYRHEKR